MKAELKQKIVEMLENETVPVSILAADGDKLIFRNRESGERLVVHGIADGLSVISKWIVAKHLEEKTEGKSRTHIHIFNRPLESRPIEKTES